PPVGVIAVPRLDVGRGADPVDAGVLPEVDRDDLATQRVGRQWARVHPALHLEGRHVHVAGRAGDPRTEGSTEKHEGQAGSHSSPSRSSLPWLRGSSCGSRYSRPRGPIPVTWVMYSPDLAQWKWKVSPGRTRTLPGGYAFRPSASNLAPRPM